VSAPYWKKQINYVNAERQNDMITQCCPNLQARRVSLYFGKFRVTAFHQTVQSRFPGIHKTSFKIRFWEAANWSSFSTTKKWFWIM